jgi:tetratricopeptide (TPR) repeat protein
MRASVLRRGASRALTVLGVILSATIATADDRALCDKQDALPDVIINACSARILNGVTGKDLAISLRNRGFGYALKDDYDRAIADYDRSIEIDPTSPKTFDLRGNAYRDRHDEDHAIVDYDQAIKLDPNDAVSFRDRGLVYRAKHDYDRALADYNEALRIDPGYRDAINERGMTYDNKGDYDRAIADFSEAIRIDPTFAQAFVNRGIIYGIKGNLDRAKSDYDAGIALKPDQAHYYNNRAFVWMKKGDFEQAFSDVEHGLRLAPHAAYLINMRGEIWRAKGDLDHAIADYTLALARQRGFALAYVNRGVAYRQKGDIDRAIADFNEVIRRYPTFGTAYYERGLTFKAQGATDRARADFEQTTTLPAANETSRHALALARDQLASLTPTSAVATATRSLPPDRRVALVIGNSAYTSVPALPNPERDAATVAATLRATGFQKVILENNLTREGLFNALRTFAADAEQSDWAVVYYAGHGIEINGTNYLIPVDAKLVIDRDVEFEAIALEKVMTAVEGARKLRLVLLDACRDNPFANQMRRSIASRSIGRGLAEIEPEAGTLVVYSAKHGETALDGDGANSPFVTALINRMKTPGIEVRRLFDLVRDDVMAMTDRRQQPFSYGSVSGAEDFYFVQK